MHILRSALDQAHELRLHLDKLLLLTLVRVARDGGHRVLRHRVVDGRLVRNGHPLLIGHILHRLVQLAVSRLGLQLLLLLLSGLVRRVLRRELGRLNYLLRNECLPEILLLIVERLLVELLHLAVVGEELRLGLKVLTLVGSAGAPEIVSLGLGRRELRLLVGKLRRLQESLRRCERLLLDLKT